ncbi:hypothetical protein D3C84_720710 [compost metagenome]
MLAPLGAVLHQHHHPLDPGHQIHGAPHALDHLARDHPVREIPALGDLHGPEQGQVDVAAADHGKTLGAVEEAAAGQCGDGLLAGVDEIGIELLFAGEGAYAEQAVLALQPHLHAVRDVVGHQGRQADPQVDVEAVLQLLCGALRHLFTGPGHRQLLTVRTSMRFSGWGFSTSRCT